MWWWPVRRRIWSSEGSSEYAAGRRAAVTWGVPAYVRRQTRTGRGSYRWIRCVCQPGRPSRTGRDDSQVNGARLARLDVPTAPFFLLSVTVQHPRWREMTSLKISEVPSPISSSFWSRKNRSMWYSFMSPYPPWIWTASVVARFMTSEQ